MRYRSDTPIPVAERAQKMPRRLSPAKHSVPYSLPYPRTDTPENDSTARPRTGWPKKRAGANTLVSSIFSTCERVAASVGPLTMR